MNPIITAFESSPDRGRGLARDMRVRWAMEEVAQPYEVRLLSFSALKDPAHRALQPFGQIPTYEDGERALFDSGAIVLHVAQAYPGLLPDEPGARARATSWMFAAVSTMEPPILDREVAFLLERDESWYEQRLPLLEARIRNRLRDLAAHLGDAEWLDGAFSAGDLLMVSVLQRLGSAGIVEGYPNLAAYVTRGMARPAFKRAFDAQYAVFLAASGGR